MHAGFTQRTVDTLFSFGELGFQEVETSRHLVGVLRENGSSPGRRVRHPDGLDRHLGTGKPVISLGSDIDGIPKASQKRAWPGTRRSSTARPARRGPQLRPGRQHHRRHRVKKIMEREHLPGTLVLWPGVAEELLGTKAYYVRRASSRTPTWCCSRTSTAR